ncbi:MAG: urea ABC transporter permease subunit UrtB [Betaproteobacteria bacterium]|nr:urea ABC transporter permease subunit UrtB [Betaproteobacteria bacterium]
MLRNLCLMLIVATAAYAPAAAAIDRAVVEKLAFGDTSEKLEAIAVLVTEGDPRAAPVLAALADGELQTAEKRVLIVKGDRATDAVTGEAVAPLPAGREDVVANNRLRREIGSALAALRVRAPDRDVRLAAARELSDSADEAMLPLIRKALELEKDAEIRSLLEMAQATLQLRSPDRVTRLDAIRTLGQSSNPSMKTLLLPIVSKKPDGAFAEPDEAVRAEAHNSLKAIEGRLEWGERFGLLFAGVSLGSILLLAALGLAITYGLMGVINMAHGELIMVGAYATYVVQNLFRAYAPDVFDWYLACAVPAAFAVSAAVGMVLERTVIRWLYGRPLETLLATWGISLVLIQAVRTIFGAQNVQVENPAFMSGGIQVLSNLVLPWNRIVIVIFAAAVVTGIWLLLTRTRLGLFVRGVTQNRAMASCVGVPTSRVDTWAFGLGSGIAGLAGCALSQIGNVGPDLGQGYIVDSFMVVVFGGVGQLAGTIYAALVLGMVNKFIESWSGAVIAKIAVLVFIIFFIQRRPQGMFALRGRAVEA